MSSAVLVHWPDDEWLRISLQRAGAPRLLIVEPGCRPPLQVDPLEDWVVSTGDPAEVGHRLASLEARSQVPAPERPTLEEGDIVRFDGRWIALSPAEAPALRVLLERFDTCVPRCELTVGRVPCSASALNTQINRIRKRIEPLGLVVKTVRGRGFALSIGTDGHDRSTDAGRSPRPGL